VVSPIPGPSAPVAALVSSGLPTDAFLYLGYLPRKQSQRRRLLAEIAGLAYTLIFLEAPHRLLETLTDLEAVLGDRPMCAARELTKLHEEIYRSSVSQARAHYLDQSPRGEFTLIVAGRQKNAAEWSEEQVLQAVSQAQACGESTAQTAASVAELSGWPRRKVYRLVLATAERTGHEPG